MVRQCLDHGAPAGYANEVGTTALHLAAATGRGDIVALLLHAGASPNGPACPGHCCAPATLAHVCAD
jgi:ankyrin repeat protein